MKFTKGARVVFKTSDGSRKTGRITSKKGKAYGIVDDDNCQYTTSKVGRGRLAMLDSLRCIKHGLFVFDTRLDNSHRSVRHSATFWREFCQAADMDYGRERVHSLADVHWLLSRPIAHPILLFNGHGHAGRGWQLSNGEIFGPHQLEDGTWCLNGSEKHSCENHRMKLHEHNRKKILIFSACELGASNALTRAFHEALDARAVISYSTVTYDSICYMVEPLLVHFLNTHKPDVAAAHTRDALKKLTPALKKGGRSFPLVCYPDSQHS